MVSTDPEAVVADALDEASVTRRESIRWLVDSTDPRTDEVVLAEYGSRRGHFPAGAVLSRVLAERDPDRDPAYLFDRFDRSGESWFARWRGRVGARWHSRFPLASTYGVTRLRKTDPVARYTHDLSGWRLRTAAVAALGDTADPVALPVLVLALRARSWRLRTDAANSVRRLVRDLGPGVVLPDEVRDALAANLVHRRDEVAAAAAHALVAAGHPEPVEQVSNPPADRAAAFQAALRGEAPPLATLWPGGTT
ncbi:HEAT repeat domain-containing protein [Actinokineospora bangkokensis]|uniref:HEAT repeat domain-containing protein n=1 Tax=Actinokineospora bangkokensis TaxID=1193682 RepID=A0A1Q9LTG6_9PSEU|nr:hypothetical protein [Actinokineospora bangkokensis]OLR95325.1 hypothetical protein BJP25_06055 [Actinokineospora bangkokensis]